MMKTALITGANKGIGFEIARQLGEKGLQVLIGARNPQKGANAVARLQAEGIQAHAVHMDVSDQASIRAAVGQIKEVVSHLDALVNNAAILLDDQSDLLRQGGDHIEATLRTNVMGPTWVCQEFLPLLRRGSRIVMLSSGAGAFCEGVSTFAPIYSISKTALNALTRHLARDLRPLGIAINAMCPGWVRTDMGGAGASRSVAQGADTAVWLASEAAPEMTDGFYRDRELIAW
jgi:NAD(P)-dependent dehydrogenase (short-subunit alcohol dehydrogenase family)